MRFIVACFLLLGCTKPNPNRCCVDEADCTANGIAPGSTCDDGRVCRGNICISQECAAASECDLAAPYCTGVPDGSCQETCSVDAECPGFGQSVDLRYCLESRCLECRSDADCATDAPVCNAGACTTCDRHDQCSSGACSANGTCALVSEIAYVSPGGSTTSDCSQAAPCSMATALNMVDRSYVFVAPGTYTHSLTWIGRARKWLIGQGTVRPVLMSGSTGPIIQPSSAAELTLEHLRVSGATTGSLGTRNGIVCGMGGSAGSTVALIDSVVDSNTDGGVASRMCTLTVVRSTFTNNGFGIEAVDSTVKVDRSYFQSNATGLSFDFGKLLLTNSFFVRNQNGLSVFANQPAETRAEFNTIVDNSGTAGFGLSCDGLAGKTLSNNLIARNTANVVGETECVGAGTGSILLGTDISSLKFRSPDTQPYDYHLLPGSSAINAAITATLDHDIDGDARPKGAGRDVGADEVE